MNLVPVRGTNHVSNDVNFVNTIYNTMYVLGIMFEHTTEYTIKV